MTGRPAPRAPGAGAERAAIVYDEAYLSHDTGSHPENAARLRAIWTRLEGTELRSRLDLVRPRRASLESVKWAHTGDHVERVRRHAARGHPLSLDTPVCRESYAVALLSAGGAIAAVDEVLDDRRDLAFCLGRPPGHHAGVERAGGFCLFNNVAIAAFHALYRYRLERILILDWDAHHGNGTQEIFYRDPRVLYFSIHQSPGYPGTGSSGETGAGTGRGYTMNVPLAPGGTDGDYRDIMDTTLAEACAQYRPQLILVSAGQDAHRCDPLASMRLSSSAFGMMTRRARALADAHCYGKMVLVLEGGYQPDALAESVVEILSALTDRHPGCGTIERADIHL